MYESLAQSCWVLNPSYTKERNIMPKKEMFKLLDDVSRSLIAENLAWAVCNKSSWQIVAAAKIEHQLNQQDYDRPQNPNVMLEDSSRALLVRAATLLEGAELDGVSTTTLENAMGEAIEGAFEINVKAMRDLNFEIPATRIVIAHYGAEFFDWKDEWHNTDGTVTSEQKDPKAVMITAEFRRDAAVKEQNQRMIVAEKRNITQQCEDRREYKDIARNLVRRILNAPDATQSVSGDGEYNEYLEARENAFRNRLKALNSNSTIIDGEWKNRYDRKGMPVVSVISEMDGHFTILLENAIKLGIEVADFEALPDSATIEAYIKQRRSAA